MNARTTWIAVVLAIALAVYFIFWRQTPSGAPVPAPRAILPALESWKPGRITEIRLLTADHPPVVFARLKTDSALWEQTEPVRFPLEGPVVEAFLNRLTTLESTATFKPKDRKIDLTTLGLSPPATQIEIRDAKGQTLFLKLGRRTAGGSGYLTTEAPSPESTVHVVDQTLHQVMAEIDLREFRDHRVADVPAGRLKTLKIIRSDESFSLQHNEAAWTLTAAGQTDRANTTSVEELAGVFQARIQKFVDDNPQNLQPYGLQTPTLRLKATLAAVPGQKKDEEIILAIGSAEDLLQQRFFARLENRPSVFLLPGAALKPLNAPADTFRDRRLIDFDPTQLTGVELHHPDRPVMKIERQNGLWNWADPKPAFLPDSERLAQWLTAITDTQADGFVSPPVEPDPDAIEIHLLTSPSTTPRILRIFQPAPQQIVVRNPQRPLGLQLKSPKGMVFLAPVETFRDRTVWPFQSADIASLSIRRRSVRPADYSAQRPAPGTVLTGSWMPDGWDPEQWKKLLAALSPLKAENWVPAASQIKPPGKDVELICTLADGKSFSLICDLSTRLAESAEFPGVFQPSPALLEVLAGELKNRRPLPLPTEQIRQISGSSWRLTHDQRGRFSTEGGMLNEPAAAALLQAIANLDALYYLPELPENPGEPLRLTLTESQGNQHVLEIWPATNPPMIRLNEKTVFEISPQQAKSLSQSPVR